MSVQYDKMSEIYNFQYGKGNTNPDNGGKYPVYGSNGIIGSYDKYNSENSPIVGHIGANCGSVVFGFGKHYVTYNGVICKIKPLNDKWFGYYALLASNIKSRVLGSAQPFISYHILNRLLVFKTNYENQKRIGRLLRKYDDLVEKNAKRVHILEKVAIDLYIEWFVKFRFPGVENVEFQSQDPKGWFLSTTENAHKIPHNWKFAELKNIAQFKRGKNITSSEMIEGDIPVISAGLQPSGYHNEANVFGKNLTISASGANAGYLSYHLSDVWAADCSYYQDDKNIWFVYNALKFLQPVISNMQVGSAQPHVYAKNINKLSTIIPPDELIELYCDKVDPIYEQIRILNLMNENLVKQRDALLPRLMSGRLNLEGKEIV